MSTAAHLYASVIDDVVAQVRDSFLDEAVDENVLQELKSIWTAKLEASKTVETAPKTHEAAAAGMDQKAARGGKQGQHLQQRQVGRAPGGAAAGVPAGQPGGSGAAPADLLLQMHEIVPVQITVPAQPGNPSSQPRALTVKVPAHALQKTGTTSAMLQTLLQQAIAQALTLPDSHAAIFLQTQISNAFNMKLPPQ